MTRKEKPPELQWREITERLFKHLMEWETDYSGGCDEACVMDMHSVLDEYEEQWADLVEWEIENARA